MTNQPAIIKHFQNRRSLHSNYFNIGLKLTIFNVTLILWLTLFPYQFSTHDLMTNLRDPELLKHIFGEWSQWLDLILNVIMFCPFGFGVMALGWSARRNDGLGWPLFWGFLFSLGLELTQFFLPTRHPSIADIITNSSGCFLGACLFKRYKYVLNVRTHRLFRRVPIAGFGCMALATGVILFAFSLWLQGRTTLANWDDNFHLVLHNEYSGDRPWNGWVECIQLADKAVSESDVQLLLSGKKSAMFDAQTFLTIQFDKTQALPKVSGELPSFRKKYNNANADNLSSILGHNDWLVTESPAKALTETLRKSGQLTLLVTFNTADTSQSGPARILSLSKDAGKRNLTLAQEGGKLVYRLRTGVTGENGRYPHIITDASLRANVQHRIIASYDGKRQTIYVDEISRRHTINYSLGAALFSTIKETSLSEFNTYRISYAALMAMPLALLAAMAVQRLHLNRGPANTLMSGYGLLLLLFVELGLVIFAKDYRLDIASVLFVWLFFTGIYLFLSHKFTNSFE